MKEIYYNDEKVKGKAKANGTRVTCYIPQRNIQAVEKITVSPK